MKPLSSASPHAIIMVGIPGSGKSTFAEHFAETFQAPIINYVKLQKDFDLDPEKASALSTLMLTEFIKTKRTVVIEGNTDTRKGRAELEKFFTKAGYKSLFVWVQTEPSEARRRATKAYPKGSGLSSDEFSEAVSRLEMPQKPEKVVVISGRHTYTTQVKIVLKQLAAGPTSTPQAHHTPKAPAPTPTGQPPVASPADNRSRGRSIAIR